MVHSRPMPSLRTTSLEPAQGVLQAPASRVAQMRVLRSPLLSHRSGLAGGGKDRLANGKAELVLHKN